MEHTGNKLIFLLLALILNVNQGFTIWDMLPLLVALCATFGNELLSKHAKYYFYIGIYISIILIPNLVWYLPLFVYDCFESNHSLWYYSPITFYLMRLYPNYIITLILTVAIVLAIVFKKRYLYLCTLLDLYKKQRDSTKEVSLLMEDRQRNLLEKQEYEIRLATLNERNRIAREIHDNVGHLLSSSLLQVGAVTTINEQESLKEPLHQIKDTLNEAMNSIRTSVHDLHDDSIELSVEIQKLCDAFAFCTCDYIYAIEHSMPNEYIYHIIAILKEALHNIIKHSNATKVMITLREQPRFYQLIIQDNGTKNNTTSEHGIGLINMRTRVEACHGLIHCSQDHGFRIFITLPKEK